MNKLEMIDKERNTISTRELAEMMDTKHTLILRKVEEIISVLVKNDIEVSDYFIKSKYTDKRGKEGIYYLCTKMGCELLLHKQGGVKGILFTAHYIERFNQMKSSLTYKEALMEFMKEEEKSCI